MKKIIAIISIIISGMFFCVNGQSVKKTSDSAQMKMVWVLQKKLNINESQVARIAALYKSRQKTTDSLRMQFKKTQIKDSAALIRQYSKEFQAEFEKILTDKQKKLYYEIQQQQKSDFIDRMKKRNITVTESKE